MSWSTQSQWLNQRRTSFFRIPRILGPGAKETAPKQEKHPWRLATRKLQAHCNRHSDNQLSWGGIKWMSMKMTKMKTLKASSNQYQAAGTKSFRGHQVEIIKCRSESSKPIWWRVIPQKASPARAKKWPSRGDQYPQRSLAAAGLSRDIQKLL